MEPLRDLHQLADDVVNNFKKNFNARDCKIPEEFKKKVKFLNSFSVVYNDYSVVIKGDGTRSFDSYVPNQCFYMASFFIEYSNELSKYKQKIIPWITNAGIPTSGLTAFFTEERDNGKQNITKGIDKFVNILDSIKYNGSDRDNIIKFVTDYGWWHGNKTIDRYDFYNSPVLTIMGLSASSNATMALIVNFLTQNPDMNSLLKLKAVKHIGEPLQQIFYGAPGTGKSHTIKEKAKGYEVIRTTFHPDSDYSTFVGAYKPTMGDPKPIYGFDSSGNTVKVEDPLGAIVKDRKIEYRFIKQAFLKAYLKAWKNYSDGVTTTTTTTITTPMPSSSTATPYKSKGSGTIAADFDYTSDKGITISPDDLELLKKVDAFLFPFTDDIDCFGELHNTIEVIVTDKPANGQLPKTKKVKYDIKALREELKGLANNPQLHEQDGNPESEKVSKRLGYLSDFLPMICQKYNSQNGTNFTLEQLPDEVEIESVLTLLGLCQKSSSGIKVYLFMDNINDGIHNTERLISTYIHEMFHVYYNTIGIPDKIEEPIVECSMLCFLELISGIVTEFNNILNYSSREVKGKKNSCFSHYGFGAFLFENRSLDWIKMFKDGHKSINSTSDLVQEYCEGFEKLYPICEEYDYMKKLWYILHGKTSFSTYSSYKPVFLIIEEINRGNCAQIFGDIFQLLDRSDEGFSQYPIEPDTDIQMEIERAFREDLEYRIIGNINVEGKVEDYTSTTGKTISEDIQSGHVMLLPNNLFIWATMNTSDQSLFPIDSAFKRRWEWNYIKIKDYPEKDYKIKTENKEYNWGDFLAKINTIIASITSSADKQLGYFFCKPKDGKNITADVFVSKVIFYLWNDVFKDYGFEDTTLFRYKKTDSTGKESEEDLTFPDFYDIDGVKVNTERVEDFLDKVINWKKKDEVNN